MSDAGIPQSPPRPAGPVPPQASGQDQKARVEAATGDLARVMRAISVTGTVTARNNDGSIRITTQGGTIDVSTRNPPAPGRTVEIDISPGNPPRQAVIRAADPAPQTTAPPAQASGTTTAPPPQPIPQSASAAPATQSATTTPAISSSAPPADTASTSQSATPRTPPAPRLSDSANAALTEQLQQPDETPPPPAPLEPGDQVRLTALPPDQAIALLQQAAEATPAAPPLLTQTATPPGGLEAKPLPDPLALTKNLSALPGLTKAATPVSPAAIQPLLSAAKTPVPSTTRPPLIPLSTQPMEEPAIAARPPPVLDIKIIAIHPPGAAAATPAPTFPAPQAAPAQKPAPPTESEKPQSPAPAILTAQVTGKTAANLPILTMTLPGQSYPSHFVLQFNAANLPDGATISFTPQTKTESPDTLPALGGPTDPTPSYELLSSFQWPALDNLKAALIPLDPQAAQTLTHTLPAPATPAQVPAAAMFFVAALRSGDIEGWLGDKTVNLLRTAGKADAIGKLSRDMAGINKLDTPPAAPEDWRGLALPVVYGGEIQKMMLYYRHDQQRPKDAGSADKTRNTRFIFDLSLTRMGAVQLDGLHRPPPEGKAEGRLDLIVRTHAALSQTMQQAMRAAYTEALSRSGHTGEMSFQNRPEQFMKVSLSPQGNPVSV